MGTIREHAEELRDRKRWIPAGHLARSDGQLDPVVKCPWCWALVLQNDTDIHEHGQWHVSHMVAHKHDETVQGPHSGEHT